MNNDTDAWCQGVTLNGNDVVSVTLDGDVKDGLPCWMRVSVHVYADITQKRTSSYNVQFTLTSVTPIAGYGGADIRILGKKISNVKVFDIGLGYNKNFFQSKYYGGDYALEINEGGGFVAMDRYSTTWTKFQETWIGVSKQNIYQNLYR